ncbi:hypothetical protein HAX54_018660, partial [Datura stramonium]|nr:hypothetical protein [Datura stramonium]
VCSTLPARSYENLHREEGENQNIHVKLGFTKERVILGNLSCHWGKGNEGFCHPISGNRGESSQFILKGKNLVVKLAFNGLVLEINVSACLSLSEEQLSDTPYTCTPALAYGPGV